MECSPKWNIANKGPDSSWKAVAWKFSNAIIEGLEDLEDEALFASQATSPGSVSGQVLRPTASHAENNDSFVKVIDLSLL